MVRRESPGLTLQNKNVASIKAGCIDGLDWSKAIHLWTNNAMVPIPESAEAHPRGVDTMSYSSLGSACSDTSSSQLDRPGILAGSGAGDLDPPGMLTGSGTCEGSVCPDELKGSPVI